MVCGMPHTLASTARSAMNQRDLVQSLTPDYRERAQSDEEA
jgi:hypothetical protein